MPVRSLTSSVFVWPDSQRVDRAAREWAAEAAARHPELKRVGYFGSYARGDAGVGSDLDLVAIVESTDRPFEERAVDWDVDGLPVPAEILIYTRREWDQMISGGGRFAHVLQHETVWLLPSDSSPSPS